MTAGKSADECTICGEEQDVAEWRRWKPEDNRVCTDCWFDELTADERREHAEMAHRRRTERLKEEAR